MARLREFYSRVLDMVPSGDGDAPTFVSEHGALALFSADGMEAMAPGSTIDAGAGNCVLEFRVDDVDHEYERLCEMGVPVVKPPATYPWGRRSAWFRDPDGNIINLYATVPAPKYNI
jgi:predicted enzyme related to lactoylglutathione lyase